MKNSDCDWDMLIAADFTRGGERSFRLAEEVRSHALAGLRVGLVQTRQPGPGDVIAPEVQTCIRRGHATALDPSGHHSAARMIAHQPSQADWSLRALRSAGDILLVCYDPPDFDCRPQARTLRHVPVNPFLRPRQRGNRDIWLPVLSATEPRPRRSGPPAVGWIGAGVTDTIIEAAEADGLPSYHFLPEGGHASVLRAAPLGSLSLDRLIAGLDVLVVVPASGAFDLPDTTIAAALDAGLEVVLPAGLQAHYGRGPRYAAPGQIGAAVRAAIAAVRKGPVHRARPGAFAARCRKRHSDLTRPASAPVLPAPRPTLCLAANGVGVGHLTRLLAIARRFEGEVIFASQVPALEILDGYGFQGEYLPSAATVGGDFDLWDGWFGAHLTRLLDRYDPGLVVYDGNHASWGLIGAVAARRDCRMAWIRRGMWANTTSQHLKNARWCDLVIEPGELAAERDTGITARLRHEAVQVAPIRLLDEPELFDRAEACARLGLDPRRPAVLIQLGSGYNRDLLSLLDQIIGMLTPNAGLQIAVAEWVNGTIPLSLWPAVKVVRGFPISQYLRAFDFCISAAGYNSYHELISFAVPTVFVANRHPAMDDQYNRAKFAQDSSAAFEITEHDLRDLPELIALLMQDRPRAFLADHCRQLGTPNGAEAAARHLAVLSRQAEGVRG